MFHSVNMFRSLAMFLRWKNTVFVTWEILFSIDKLLSNITPRFLNYRGCNSTSRLVANCNARDSVYCIFLVQ